MFDIFTGVHETMVTILLVLHWVICELEPQRTNGQLSLNHLSNCVSSFEHVSKLRAALCNFLVSSNSFISDIKKAPTSCVEMWNTMNVHMIIGSHGLAINFSFFSTFLFPGPYLERAVCHQRSSRQRLPQRAGQEQQPSNYGPVWLQR